jgi:hypothetical protein
VKKISLLLLGLTLGLAPAMTAASASTASVQNRVQFKIYPPTYFAGFTPSAFQYQDGTYCPDHSNSAFVLGGQGSLNNALPGVSIFERVAGSCRVPRQSGTPTAFQTLNIHGHVGTVSTGCLGVAKTACNASRVKQFGGLITWKVPGVGRYKATEISVSTYNLSYATLLKVAQGIETVN